MVRTPKLVHESGRTVADALEAYPHLSREEVLAALEYDDAHPEAIDVIRKRREAAERRLRARSRAPATEDSETGA